MTRFSFIKLSASIQVLTLFVDCAFAAESRWVNCSLCSNPGDVPYDPFAMFRSGGEVLSCEQAFNRGIVPLPAENCTFLQQWGTEFCQCGLEPVDNDCTLCENSSLPDGLIEGLPSQSCAELEADARRDSPETCIIWQRTVGTYCGCDNPTASQEKCYLCGGTVPLPNITHITTSTASCGEVEFEANLPSSNCVEFQEQYGSECCPITNTTQERDISPGSRSHTSMSGFFLNSIIITISFIFLV